MGKKKLFLSLAAFAIVVMTTQAWAQEQTYTMGGVNTDPAGQYANVEAFAKEIFGPDSNSVELTLNTSTTVELGLNDDDTPIGASRKANLKFCLDGPDGNRPQFASDAPGLVYTQAGAPSGEITSQISTDASDGMGRVGDSCVTYTLTTTASVDHAASTFSLRMPNIKNVAFLGEADNPGPDNQPGTSDDVPPLVTVSVTLVPDDLGADPTTNGFARFPAATATANANKRTLIRSLDRFGMVVSPTSTSTDRQVLISLDDRTMFASGAGISNTRVETVTGIGDGQRSAIVLSTVQVDKNAQANGANGSLLAPVSGASGDKLDISVESNGMSFTDSDVVFLSANAAYSLTDDILLTTSGNSASSSASLVDVTAAADIASGAEMKLYYVPATGSTLMRDSTFTTTYGLNFAAATKKDSEMTTAAVTMELAGLSTRGYAYAFTPDNSPAGDRGTLRIRCEDTSDCVVFLECFNHAGDRVGDFQSIGDDIAPNAVAVVSSDDLEDLIGSWRGQGRLSCEVVASGPVGVQMFTRSSSGVLVNNSYINRGADSSSSD